MNDKKKEKKTKQKSAEREFGYKDEQEKTFKPF